MKYFIADCHFFHEKLNTQMDCRGFSDAAEMNAYMLKKWNDRVRSTDDVYILGDLSVGNAEQTNALLKQLRGKLYLVELKLDKRVFAKKCGNHDLDGIILKVDLLNDSRKAVKHIVYNIDSVAYIIRYFDNSLFDSEPDNFFVAEGDRFVFGTDKSGNTSGVADEKPCFIAHLGHIIPVGSDRDLDEHISGEELTLDVFIFFGIVNYLYRDLDFKYLILHFLVFNQFFNVCLYGILISGVGMDYIPSCLNRHFQPSRISLRKSS